MVVPLCPCWYGRQPYIARPPSLSVFVTRPYHWPGARLNLTAGPGVDPRGYEPNELLCWQDGFGQAIPESLWAALPRSHFSPPSAPRRSIPFSVSCVRLPPFLSWARYLFHTSFLCVSPSLLLSCLHLFPSPQVWNLWPFLGFRQPTSQLSLKLTTFPDWWLFPSFEPAVKILIEQDQIDILLSPQSVCRSADDTDSTGYGLCWWAMDWKDVVCANWKLDYGALIGQPKVSGLGLRRKWTFSPTKMATLSLGCHFKYKQNHSFIAYILI